MKKYSKILVVMLLSLACFFASSEVNAKESSRQESGSYFINDNGVSFTKAEYDFFTKMYYEGYQKIMTQDEFNEFVEMDFLNADFKSNSYSPSFETRGSEFVTSAKSLKISRLCSDDCRVSVIVEWNGTPAAKGYDVIGAYLEGTKVKTTVTTRVGNSGGTTYATAKTKKQANGFGASVQLPSGTDIVINQSYSATKGGKIYASYQHAMSSTTYETSQQFNISRVGYGGVFEFYGSAANLYDAMPGVEIDL